MVGTCNWRRELVDRLVFREWDKKQSGNEQRKRKERDVARSGSENRWVERAERGSLQERSRHSLQPAPFLAVETREQQILEDERCSEENGETVD